MMQDFYCNSCHVVFAKGVAHITIDPPFLFLDFITCSACVTIYASVSEFGSEESSIRSLGKPIFFDSQDGLDRGDLSIHNQSRLTSMLMSAPQIFTMSVIKLLKSPVKFSCIHCEKIISEHPAEVNACPNCDSTDLHIGIQFTY